MRDYLIFRKKILSFLQKWGNFGLLETGKHFNTKKRKFYHSKNKCAFLKCRKQRNFDVQKKRKFCGFGKMGTSFES
jgi:hypothetical protein